MAAILQVSHGVRDYDAWKSAFDGDPIDRAGGGVRRHRILRSAESPSDVVIELEFETVQEAERFQAALRELWGRVADKVGLEHPEARVLETLETREY